MPILKKTIEEIINNGLIKSDKINYMLVIYLSDKNDNPMLVMHDYNVHNTDDVELFIKKWNNLCSQFGNSYISNNDNKLSLRIMEMDENGYMVNVLGKNVSLINFEC